MAERRLTRGRQGGEAAAAADAEAHRTTPIDRQLLRSASNARVPDDVLTAVLTYCDEHELSAAGTLEAHYKVAYERAKEAQDDARMAFRNLVQTLTGRRNLERGISSINLELYEPVEGAGRVEGQGLDHPQLLKLLRSVCEQYEKEEPLRISSKYELAMNILVQAGDTLKVDLSRLSVRGDVYAKTDMCDTCVPLDEINKKVLDVDFDSELHLAPGAIDFSEEGFTCQIAAKPGSDSRLALTKIANDPRVLDLILKMPWVCYCWASIAQILHYLVSRCVQHVYGSVLALPMARGIIGPAPAVVALGTVRNKWDLEQLKAFEASIESRKGRVKRVLSFAYLENWPSRTVDLEVLEVSDDKDKPLALVKICSKESTTIDKYRNSKGPLGGLKLIDRRESVPFVTIENVGVEHPFIESVIESCPTKLDALSAFPAICVESGLNNTSRAFHYVSKPVNCPALEAILRAPQEVFVAASGRNLIIYHPPTEAQHEATLELIDGHVRNGTVALVHHQRDEGAQTNSATGSFADCAKKTSDRAFEFVRDVLNCTLDEDNVYGPCQFASPVPLTEMQRMKALLISEPGGAAEAVAYLTPRVGKAHVDVLKAFGLELAKKKDEILELAAAASAPVGGTRKRRRG